MNQLELFTPRSKMEDELLGRGKSNKSKRGGGNRSTIKVAELFAGVGGFRLGLEKHASSTNRHSRVFKTVWANQWEPGSTKQHAATVYKSRFGKDGRLFATDRLDTLFGTNIEDVVLNSLSEIPAHEMLCGGFPCQDYSVAKARGKATGLLGKKGVLWWSIFSIVQRKRPKVLLLENVDRLLKSPTGARGRDFAIMLASLARLGYVVEWRVVNAADYGFPQRRRRVFVLAYRKSFVDFQRARLAIETDSFASQWLTQQGVFSSSFPVHRKFDIALFESFELPKKYRLSSPQRYLAHVTEVFEKNHATRSPFHNCGLMAGYKVFTVHLVPKEKLSRKERQAKTWPKSARLSSYLLPLSKIRKMYPEFIVPKTAVATWKRLKDAKRIPRSRNGFDYLYSEGAMRFPDLLSAPARTIVTGEGGGTPSRFKHVVRQKGVLRRLVPEELELLSGFPAGHTAVRDANDRMVVPNARRAFLIGNALVVGVVERIGRELRKRL
jgi:DNA (cytosine-5)-methyltransferase 1